ncbi:hypothetical protein BU23DRAFT_15162 [Bimuria novae-zelandiae CBS 107.79]|uniref:Uncharacterized protein n=1 Tax=Bimuria novae-zelandiae CBS 107.79 TaxID=1447943 RepID=A0A6A5VH64_9PLEO|nr:hypothetical protein BU23DRAFT_15162 [Bimuria novae-zelandiae CBS 107.79]
MENSAKKYRIEVQPNVTQFDATDKAGRNSYLALKHAYIPVRKAQLDLKKCELEEIYPKPIRRFKTLFQNSEETDLSAKLDAASTTLEIAESKIEIALQRYCATWCGRISVMLLALPRELRDMIYRELVVTHYHDDTRWEHRTFLQVSQADTVSWKSPPARCRVTTNSSARLSGKRYKR